MNPSMFPRWSVALHAVLSRKMFSLLLRCCLPILRICCPKGVAISSGRYLARIPGVHYLIVPLWYRVLSHVARPWAAAEWMQWAVNRWPRPAWYALAAEAAIAARCFDEAEVLLAQVRTALQTTDRHGSLYHFIVDLEAILAIERGLESADIAFFTAGRPRLEAYCYRRAWDAHAVMNGHLVRYYLDCFLRAVDYNPDLYLSIFESLIVPNALWNSALQALDEVERRLPDQVDPSIAVAPTQPSLQNFVPQLFGVLQANKIDGEIKAHRTSRLHACRARALIESGQFVAAREILNKDELQSIERCYLSGLIHLYDPERTDAQLGRRMMSLVYANPKAPFRLRSEAAGETAISFEESRDYKSAYLYYSSSFYLKGAPYFLPEYLWRYVSLCMAQHNYSEAAHVMRSGLVTLWASFQRLARTSVRKRFRTGRLIPERGAFFIGCWGLGDDILRLAMLDALGFAKRQGYGMSVDPRMQSLYARSLPNLEFVPISRRSGPFAVSEKDYVRLREGVPQGLDRGRLDKVVLEATKRYRDTALTEDILVAFIQAGEKRQREDRPLLKVSADRQQSAREWLATLPPGITVGISWRSGHRDMIRNKSYTDLVQDWGGVLAVAGVTFVNLQYGYEQEELDEAVRRHGGEIHTMPGVDLKDDLEDVAALATVLDVVIAPGTAVRELCAAAGAAVWSLSTTPMLPDRWRQIDGDIRDRLFPNMIHLSSCEFGDARAVLVEVARRLQAMTAGPV